jgi:hypothetical protein
MAKGDFCLQLDIDDWLNDPCLRAMKRENRDSWMTVCLLMKKQGTYFFEGTRDVLADMLTLSLGEFDEFIRDLKRTKTADVTLVSRNRHANVTEMSRSKNVTVTLMSRRFQKELQASEEEAKVREQNRLRKQRERERLRNGEVSRDCHDSVTNNDSQPPLNKSLNTRITTNFTKKGEEVENSKTESGHASTKPKTKKPDDPRAIHPAIAMVQEIMTLYPKKGLWDRIIREIGSEPDKEFFRESFELWLSVNGNPMNLQKWLLGPNATKRLPEVYGAKEDGTGKQNGNTNRRTSVDKLRDQSELLDDYPSEADLAGVKGKT